MPNATDLTVKKADNTTDIAYAVVSPSSGDTVPAAWRATSVGSAIAHQPEFRLSARDMKNGANREVRVTYRYPMIVTDTNLSTTTVISAATASVNFSFPKTMSSASVAEASAQFVNLLDTTLVQSCLKTGTGAF